MMTPVEVDFVEAQDALVSAHLRVLALNRELNQIVIEVAGLAGEDLKARLRRCDELRVLIRRSHEQYDMATGIMLGAMETLSVERAELENVLEKRGEEPKP
jgi:hypothetical protein